MDWNAMAAPWLQVEAQTDAAHGPVLDGIMARAGLQPGQRVLDIGPGGGVSLVRAAHAVGPAGHVTGIEIAPPFAKRARARVPGHVTVDLGDAQTHPFAEGSYDAAISLFGVMFFEDSVAAFSNIRAALKPGGALTFACWGAREANPWFSMPGQVAEHVLGPGPAPDPDAPGPMRFGDAQALDALLRRAGFQPEVEPVDLHLTPQGHPEEVADMMMTIGSATSRMRAAADNGTLSDEQTRAVRTGLVAGFAEMVEGGAVRVPARINFVRAIA
ncbi:MAG: class I SAM-dependent methyltransferase [Pseudomonadota bacterium]